MMPYLEVRQVKGKDYKVYVESKGKMTVSKAKALRLALAEAMKDEEHVTELDFIPGMFVLQLHGWCSREIDPYKSASKFQKAALGWARAGKDPLKEAEKVTGGKFHFDNRIWKFTAPTWFGMTHFSAPWKGTAESKTLGTIKGIGAETKAGRETQRFLIKRAKEKGHEIVERADRLFWLKVKAGYWPPGSTANPTKKQWAYMVLIDKGYCVVHRRERDFVDISFLGKFLKGRYYNRLVKRDSELNFYFWKAKTGQFDPSLIEKVARGEITLSPLEQAKAQKGEEPTEVKAEA